MNLYPKILLMGKNVIFFNFFENADFSSTLRAGLLVSPLKKMFTFLENVIFLQRASRSLQRQVYAACGEKVE